MGQKPQLDLIIFFVPGSFTETTRLQRLPVYDGNYATGAP